MTFIRTPVFFSLICLIFLTACAVDDAVKKIGQVIMDPQIEIGPPEKQPTKIILHTYASSGVNPNFQGNPAPIILRILAIKSDHLFMSGDYFSLSFNMEESLGKTLIEEISEEQMIPDSYKPLGPFELPKGTQRIGVIAEFVDIDGAVWRDTIVVEDHGQAIDMILLLFEDEVRIVERGD